MALGNVLNMNTKRSEEGKKESLQWKRRRDGEGKKKREKKRGRGGEERANDQSDHSFGKGKPKRRRSVHEPGPFTSGKDNATSDEYSVAHHNDDDNRQCEEDV